MAYHHKNTPPKHVQELMKGLVYIDPNETYAENAFKPGNMVKREGVSFDLIIQVLQEDSGQPNGPYDGTEDFIGKIVYAAGIDEEVGVVSSFMKFGYSPYKGHPYIDAIIQNNHP